MQDPSPASTPSASASTVRAAAIPIGPFLDDDANEVWSHRTLLAHEELAATDVLEPDPPNFQTALKNERLRPFWLKGMGKEMTGLWDRGCLKKVR